ncbi:MAG: hypothetical protein AAF431_03680 [Pseudomonadota bacterium]
MKLLHPLVYVKKLIMENPIGSLVCLVLALWLLGVRVYNEYQVDPGDIRLSSTIETLAQLKVADTAADLQRAYHYAILSAEVYGDPDASGRLLRDWELKDCDHAAVYAEWQQFTFSDPLPDKPTPNAGPQMILDEELKYGLWFRDTGPNSVEVVLAFAGTESTGDIWSNLHWLTRYWPGGWGQYDLARALGPIIQERIKARFAHKTNIEIIATGHSLGGGLAHQAAYASSDINRVFAFDSSSVTGFYSVDKDIRNESKLDMSIYRVHERGEILAYLRSLMSVLYPVTEKQPQIIEATVNFDQGQAIGQHSIEKLSCALMNSR